MTESTPSPTLQTEFSPTDTGGVPAADTCLRLRDISKSYSTNGQRVTALSDVNLAVEQSEFFCLLGPSGCGKTTLLRILSGLIDSYDGTVTIDVEDDGARPKTNMVFQENGIFPWKTVRENVGFGLKIRGVPPTERTRITNSYLEKVDLLEFADAYPHQLSGGMKQRVGIARAFANDPAVLLMDEPFGTLDAQTKRLLQEELLSIWNGAKKTVVYVTHDIEEAIRLGDRIGVLSARPGTLKTIVDVDLPRPRRESATEEEISRLKSRVWDLISEAVERSMGANRTDGS